jgi:uncharacterized membrane protein
MKRANLFLVILIASIIALLALTIIGFNVPVNNSVQDHNGMGNQMSGMGQTHTTIATDSSTSGYFWTAFAVLSALIVVSLVGFVYYLAFPQIKISSINTHRNIAAPQPVSTTTSATSSMAFESIEKTLKEDERKVINSLQLHDGKYLQKYITKETGLSKLKTHRVVARLAERGIVTLEKTGNTNMVYLADWFKKKE